MSVTMDVIQRNILKEKAITHDLTIYHQISYQIWSCYEKQLTD